MAGTISRGIKAPIVREGDDVVKIVADSVLAAAEQDGFKLQDKDVIAVTEAVVARADGNYASTDDIAADVKAKLGGGTVGVVFPILSRNRFAICLRGIARGAKKVVLMLSYPSDEVGNHLFDEELMENCNVNPYTDVLSVEEYRKAAVDAVRQLSLDVGIPATLDGIVKEEDIAFLAQSAYDDACRPGNPKDTSVEEITALYKSLLK